MKKPWGIFFGVLILGFILSLPLLAREDYLTLDEIIQLSLHESISYKIALLQWENSTIDARIKALNPPTTREEIIRQEMEMQRNKENLKKAENSIILNIIRDYLRLYSLEIQVKIAKLQLEQARRSYRLMEERVTLGESGERDLVNEKIGLQNSELNYERNLSQYEEALAFFFQTLGLAKNEKSINPEPSLIYPPLPLAMNEAYKLYLENHYSLWEQKKEKELEAINLEKIRLTSTPPLELKKEENRYQIKLYNLEKTERDIEDEFKEKWKNIQELEIRLDISENEYQLALEIFTLKEIQYQKGLLPDPDFQRANLDLLLARRSYVDLKISYINEIYRMRGDLGLTIYPVSTREEESGVNE